MNLFLRRCCPIVLLGLVLMSAGCDSLAIRFAPEKQADSTATPLSEQAIRSFWEALHAGRYDRLPEARRLLTAAYLENPRHPQISLLLAHAHLWTIAERSRLAEVPPGITDHAILAEHYFAEAHRLNPEDHRIPGWLGGVKLALGQIHQDERLTREGYFMLHDAIRAFPEFNDFSAGYVLSSKPRGDDRFREGLEDMWDNLDRCAGERIDRSNPDYRKYMAQVTQTGPKRVCWNSRIAPHNFEGFFLNMGDMLVKQGEPAKARAIYQIAKLSQDYEVWSYKALLEQRLAQADERAQLFQASDPTRQPEILFNSAQACTACHQQ
ncbi:MAG: hypothetical protein KGI53_06020 [Nitrospirota bacterium]|nr:hypothetical protein [Nitrospirota bacterium]